MLVIDVYITYITSYLFSDSENEDFDDSVKDKDWKIKESSKKSSVGSTLKFEINNID